MMSCEQFRESMDCYVDGELSATAAAAADAHRRECRQCDRAVTSLLELRKALQQTVSAVSVPSDLETGVTAALRPRWLPPVGASGSLWASRLAMTLGAAVIVVAGFVTTVTRPPIDASTANAMDRLALRLDDSSAVVLEGTLLCRDCELEHRYGIKASCRSIGHHGAIFSADGRVWNIVEQRSSATLIHDETLFGRKVIVRGRLFRGARVLVIDSYQLES